MHLSTYSIVGADPEAGEVGVAVQSKFLAVGAIVPWAEGGVGAVATQAFPDLTQGPRSLSGLAAGVEPEDVLAEVMAGDALREQRQVGLVTADGRAASHTGAECFDWAGAVTGYGFAAQGNVLAGPGVVEAMADAFQRTEGPLAVRLLRALEAGQSAGGERRGMESAALMVRKPGGGYGGNHDRMLDLRVDHDDQPIDRLAELLDLHDLYFGSSPADTWVPFDHDLRVEVEQRLRAAGWTREGADLESALSSYLGWENLEERWHGMHALDPRVLDYLRTHTPPPPLGA